MHRPAVCWELKVHKVRKASFKGLILLQNFISSYERIQTYNWVDYLSQYPTAVGNENHWLPSMYDCVLVNVSSVFEIFFMWQENVTYLEGVSWLSWERKWGIHFSCSSIHRYWSVSFVNLWSKTMKTKILIESWLELIQIHGPFCRVEYCPISYKVVEIIK
jgi:hypothetical protein